MTLLADPDFPLKTGDEFLYTWKPDGAFA